MVDFDFDFDVDFGLTSASASTPIPTPTPTPTPNELRASGVRTVILSRHEGSLGLGFETDGLVIRIVSKRAREMGARAGQKILMVQGKKVETGRDLLRELDLIPQDALVSFLVFDVLPRGNSSNLHIRGRSSIGSALSTETEGSALDRRGMVSGEFPFLSDSDGVE